MLLVIEDNDEDFLAFRRALEGPEETPPVRRFSTGDEALAYLLRQAELPEPESWLPALILLDLNLPGSDGREVLKRIKRHHRLKRIPVVIITTSSSPRDVDVCYEHGANSYMIKSMDFDRFQRDMQLLLHYWLEATLLPGSTTQNREARA